MAAKPLLKTAIFLFTSLILANSANAHWSLDNETSVLSFVTVKAEHIAEVHTFDTLSGTIDDSGAVEISIELASVNTLIPIRNERMQAMLFETNMFPTATITGQIDLNAVTAMAAGDSVQQQVEMELSLHGTSTALSAQLMINRTQDGVVATTLKPVVVTADSVGLVAGVEALREVAGLPSVSRAVPVSFTVVFDQGD